MRILLATDLSEGAERARALVASVEWPAGSLIRAISVVTPFPLLVETGASEILGLDRLAETDANARVQQVAATLRSRTVDADAVAMVGRSADEIVDEATRMAADLVVVGSRGRGGIATALLGSVSAEVADRAPCPVLVARAASVRHALLAVDASPEATRAVLVAERSPLLAHSEVVVVSVADVPFPMPAGSETPSALEQVVESYFVTLQAARGNAFRTAAGAATRLRATGIDATPQRREGHAAEEIIRAAEESDADLIVIGSRGETGLRRLVNGSVARSVLLNARCSVLVVRDVVDVPARSMAERGELVAH